MVMVTVKDIASKLGVSASTVTRALANNPRISDKTRKLVQKTAVEMGYVVDTAAQTMRKRSSTLIGLIIPDVENSFYARIAKAFSDVCNKEGYQLTLAVSEDNSETEEHHIRQLISAKCAGIALVPTSNLTPQSVSLLKNRNLAQLIRRSNQLDTDWYGINDQAALKEVTERLLDMGHRRIGLICGQENLNSGKDRYEGYALALKARSINIDEGLVFRGAPRSAFAQKSANQMQVMPSPPSAIIAAGAALSEGMLNAVSSWPAKDQNNISLIGYSDCNAFRWWGTSGLTAIDLPITQIATDLCTALITRAKTENIAEHKPVDFLYDSHLILRGSVRPLPTN